MTRSSLTLALLAVALAAPATCVAQSDGFAFTGINFNFTNPGARARGIGGAFVAIADDSTAALANPAGLAYLTREVTAEWIADQDEYPVGQLTQGGVDFANLGLERVYTAESDPFRVRTTSEEDRLNYASVILPIRSQRLVLAAYFATLADMAASFRVDDGLMCVDGSGRAFLPGAGESCTENFLDPDTELGILAFGQNVAYELETVLYGAALGYRLSDEWSVGLSVAHAETRMTAAADIDRSLTGFGDIAQLSTVDDTDVLYSAGVLYRADRWGFGVNYRSSGDFETLSSRGPVGGEPAERFAGTFTVPERWAAGLALFPTESWVVAAEVDWIPYSDVLAGMPPFNTDAADGDIEYRISDVTEYHLGVEYSTFAERRGWSLRLGWWRDRSHLPWVEEPYVNAREGVDTLRAVESLVRAKADADIDHYTAGIGVSLGTWVRIDAAVDWTEESGTDALVSAVLYF